MVAVTVFETDDGDHYDDGAHDGDDYECVFTWPVVRTFD